MTCEILSVNELCCHCRHLAGGDSVAVENEVHRIQNYNGKVSVQNRHYHTTDLRRLNKAAIVIQVSISSQHLL